MPDHLRQPPIIFVSHARKDSEGEKNSYFQRVVDFLEPHRKRGDIEIKYDIVDLKAATEVKPEIESWIAEGAASICLLSRNYFTREFIHDFEMKWIAKRLESTQRKYHTVSFIINVCGWDKHEMFAKFTRFPNEGRNLSDITSDSEVDTIIQTAIDDLVQLIKKDFQETESKPDNNNGGIKKGVLPSRIQKSANAIIGRQGLIEDCEYEMKRIRALALYGPPGQGKTELAREIALKIESDFPDGIVEVDLQNETSLTNTNSAIARAIALKDDVSLEDEISKRRYLLLLDGVDKVISENKNEALNEYINSMVGSMENGSKIIFTSQAEIPHNLVKSILVTQLDEKYCIELFHKFSDNRYIDENEDELIEFITELNWHTQSIIVIARYVKNQLVPFSKVKDLWIKQWSKVAEWPYSIDAKKLMTSFEITYSALNDDTKRLFLAMSSFPDGIGRNGVDSIWSDFDEVNTAIDGLRQFGLFEGRFLEIERFRLSGPLFKFSEHKREELRRSGNAAAKDMLRADLESIDNYYDEFIERYAPRSDDANPAEKNSHINSQFHNIHCSLERRLDVAGGENIPEAAVLSAADNVLKLFHAYHNNMSGMRNSYASTDDSIQYLEKANKIFEATEHNEKAVVSNHGIGTIYWLAGDSDKARPYFQDALESEYCTSNMRSHIYRAFAHIDYSNGHFAAADENFQKRSDNFLEMNDEVSYAKCQIGRIDLLRKLCDYDGALNIVDGLNDYVELLPMSDRVNITRGKAYVQFLGGDLEDAKQTYLEGIQQAIMSDSPFAQAHCQRGLGDVYVSMDDFPRAEEKFDLALKLYREAKKFRSLGVALVYLGQSRLAAAMKEYRTAIKLLMDVITMLDKGDLNQPYEFAIANQRIAEVYLDIEQPSAADRYLKIAKLTFEKMGVDARVLEVKRIQERLAQVG